MLTTSWAKRRTIVCRQRFRGCCEMAEELRSSLTKANKGQKLTGERRQRARRILRCSLCTACSIASSQRSDGPKAGYFDSSMLAWFRCPSRNQAASPPCLCPAGDSLRYQQSAKKSMPTSDFSSSASYLHLTCRIADSRLQLQDTVREAEQADQSSGWLCWSLECLCPSKRDWSKS